METRVYTSRREENFLRIFIEIIKGFKNGRELAWRLFLRDLKVSYSRSFLGIFWLFLPPLTTASIWIFLNTQKVVTIIEAPMLYSSFILCGTMIWSLFTEAITKPMQRYQASMGMMVKLNFPREAIMLASIYDLFFSMLLKLSILIPVLWLMGYSPTISFFPAFLFIILLIISGLSLGIILAPLGLLISDIGKSLSVILPFAMYITPVIYPLRKVGVLYTLQKFNPVTPFLERARSLIGGYSFTMQTELLCWSIGIFILIIVGLVVLRFALPIIVERSGA